MCCPSAPASWALPTAARVSEREREGGRGARFESKLEGGAVAAAADADVQLRGGPLLNCACSVCAIASHARSHDVRCVDHPPSNFTPRFSSSSVSGVKEHIITTPGKKTKPEARKQHCQGQQHHITPPLINWTRCADHPRSPPEQI